MALSPVISIPVALAALASLQTATAQSPTTDIPFAAVANAGQWDPAAAFQVNRSGQLAWFTRDGWTLDVAGRADAPTEPAPGTNGHPFAPAAEVRRIALAMRFAGGAAAAITPARPLAAPFRFYRGRDAFSARGHQELRYDAVLPGIDCVVRPGAGLFAFDLHVAAGADPARFAMTCAGMRSMAVDTGGGLVLGTAVGALRLSAPRAWQTTPDGRTLPVPVRFEPRGADRFGFAVDDRDPELPLVIDPDVSWGTFLGGTGWEDVYAIARQGGSGARAPFTVCGTTRSANFPRTSGPMPAGDLDAWVARLDPSKAGASQLVYSALLSGAADDFAYDVDHDVLGNATVVGITRSNGAANGYPTTAGAAQTSFGGGTFDGFVTQLNATGAMLFSTFLGGAGQDRAVSVKVSVNLEVIVAGYTDSSAGLPISSNALQRTIAGGQDAFVARLHQTGGSVPYCSYLGGGGLDGWPFNTTSPNYYDMGTMDLAYHPTGRILVVGRTESSNFPQRSPYQPAWQGNSDCFATILDTAAIGPAQLVYSTLVGGSAYDAAESCAFETATRIVVGGWTYSGNFPTTPGAVQRAHTGFNNDAHVLWLDTTQTGSNQLVYSTLLGGRAWDSATEMDVDRNGVAHLAGWCSDGFPTTATALIRNIPGAGGRGWFGRVAPGGNGQADLVYSTQLGDPTGAVGSYASGVAADGAGGSYVTGNTDYASLPVRNGYSTTHSGGRDGYVLQVWGLNPGIAAVGESNPTSCAGALAFGAEGFAAKGNTGFALIAWGADANAPGFLGLALGPAANIPLCGATLYANPQIVVPFGADGAGEARLPAPLASTLPSFTLRLQAVFGTPRCCITATNGLVLTL